MATSAFLALGSNLGDRLEHLRAAVMHHVYEEESKWFPALRDTGGAAKQSQLSRRFREEFERYAGAGSRQASVA